MKIFRRKTYRNFYFKLVRQSGSPEHIARGVAIGLFIGLAVPFGLHMILAFLVALLFRAQKITAVLCTWITNPYTIPFLYPFLCYIGAAIIGRDMDFSRIQNIFMVFLKDISLASFFNLSREIMLPFFVGGALFGAVAAFCGYFSAYGVIMSYRKRVQAKLARRLSVSAQGDNSFPKE